MITLQYTVEELEHLWAVLQSHLKAHQNLMAKFQQQASPQVQPAQKPEEK